MQSWCPMRTDRAANALRPLSLKTAVNRHAEGSALLEWGNTIVQATVTVENRLPPHMRSGKQKSGWLTAEYALLPRATRERVPRERLYASGRTQEIQRLIGRSLRSVMNLDLFRGQTLIVDVDVLQADGGTRCAGIVAGYSALHELATRLTFDGKISEWPLRHELAAVSAGIVNGELLLDLDAEEDNSATADINVVATSDGGIVEVQGGGENAPLSVRDYIGLVSGGISAVQTVLDTIRPVLAPVRA